MGSPSASLDGRIEFPLWEDGAEPMAACLRAAWPIPRLDQSRDYLCWCGRGHSTAIAALARDASGGAFGSVGLVSRRFRIGHVCEGLNGWLLSFVAVDPRRRGQGWAGRLYDAILNHVGQHDSQPILGFAPAETAGEHLLRSRVVQAGYCAHDLGRLQAHVRLTRPETAPDQLNPSVWTLVPGDSEDQTGSPTDWLNEFRTMMSREDSSASEPLLTEADEASAWLAWANDPRGRVIVVHRDNDGRPDWAAGLVWAAVAEADHVRRVLQVERLTIAPGRPPIWAELAELGDHLAATGLGLRGEPRFDSTAPPPMLSVAFDPTRTETASGPWANPRSARFRAVGAAFTAIWFLPNQGPAAETPIPAWTHLEIV